MNMITRFLCCWYLAVTCSCWIPTVTAFVSNSFNRNVAPSPSRRGLWNSVVPHDGSLADHNGATTTRRDVWKQAIGTTSCSAFAILSLNPTRAAATTLSQEEQDKKKILQGYQRLSYLLENWEKETTACIKGETFDRGCERTPEKVMEYLGYKSMDDPLFRADKTLLRLRDLVSAENDAEYGEAFDKWVEQAEEASGMAYISTWGEANPGGGKDRVALFLARSKKNVEKAHDSLETVVKLLDLK